MTNNVNLDFYSADLSTDNGQALVNRTIADVSGLPLQDWVNSDSAALDLLESLGQPYHLQKWMGGNDLPVNYEVHIGYRGHKQAQWSDLRRAAASARAYLIWMLLSVEPSADDVTFALVDAQQRLKAAQREVDQLTAVRDGDNGDE